MPRADPRRRQARTRLPRREAVEHVGRRHGATSRGTPHGRATVNNARWYATHVGVIGSASVVGGTSSASVARRALHRDHRRDAHRPRHATPRAARSIARTSATRQSSGHVRSACRGRRGVVGLAPRSARRFGRHRRPPRTRGPATPASSRSAVTLAVCRGHHSRGPPRRGPRQHAGEDVVVMAATSSRRQRDHRRRWRHPAVPSMSQHAKPRNVTDGGSSKHSNATPPSPVGSIEAAPPVRPRPHAQLRWPPALGCTHSPHFRGMLATDPSTRASLRSVDGRGHVTRTHDRSSSPGSWSRRSWAWSPTRAPRGSRGCPSRRHLRSAPPDDGRHVGPFVAQAVGRCRMVRARPSDDSPLRFHPVGRRHWWRATQRTQRPSAAVPSAAGTSSPALDLRLPRPSPRRGPARTASPRPPRPAPTRSSRRAPARRRTRPTRRSQPPPRCPSTRAAATPLGSLPREQPRHKQARDAAERQATSGPAASRAFATRPGAGFAGGGLSGTASAATGAARPRRRSDRGRRRAPSPGPRRRPAPARGDGSPRRARRATKIEIAKSAWSGSGSGGGGPGAAR